MSNNVSRRNWLKSSALLTSGLAIAPTFSTFSRSSSAALLPAHQINVWEWEHQAAFFPKKLRAKLNANENPYGPSDKSKLAIVDAMSQGNRYGHFKAGKLIEMIAEQEGVDKEYIMLGPGSTDLLEKTALVHFKDGGNIVSAEPAYMSLIKTALSQDAGWKNVPLKNWAHDLDKMEQAIDSETKLVYICNPNNPTGSVTDTKALWNFCEKAADRAPIFVDEAYLEFMEAGMDESMVGLVKAGKNVIISRTFSKIHGMAGLRIGYIVALPQTLDNIKQMVRSNMGLSIVSLAAAIASMEDQHFLEYSKKRTAETREYTAEGLKKIGFECVPSTTSFMLFPIDMEGETFLDKMYAEKIGVRAFQFFDQSYCRVSMGTTEEMSLFLEAIKKVLV